MHQRRRNSEGDNKIFRDKVNCSASIRREGRAYPVKEFVNVLATRCCILQKKFTFKSGIEEWDALLPPNPSLSSLNGRVNFEELRINSDFVILPFRERPNRADARYNIFGIISVTQSRT